ncbi:MAG TPA: DUF4388 domain-containing protein [Candidatus Saccharimonadales bacterium]|nr:DUF4388 domain-containing protein [Candidatus Saccharimonadales bacterium]
MPLKGNLDTFRLEEILQLIASQRKTGVLRLGLGDRRAILVFEEGRIVSTHEPGSREPSSLETSLSRMRRVSPDQLGRVAEMRAADGSDPQDLLLSAGLIAPEELAEFLEEHVQDLLLRALSWRSGSYEFVNYAMKPPSSGFRLAFRTEGLLMEAMRRQDEMGRFRRVLVTPAVMLSRRDTSLAHEPDPRRRRILDALVTPRLLGDLEETLPLWLFDLYEGVHDLWEAGSVEIHGAQEWKARERMQRRLARSPVEQVAFGVGMVAAMAALALGVHLAWSSLAAPRAHGPASAWEEARCAQYVDDARLAAEVYRLQHGGYPDRLARVPGWDSPPEGAPDAADPRGLTQILAGS